MASGVFATARITGQALSVAVAGAVFATLGGAAAGSALTAAAASDAGRTALDAVFLRAFHAAIASCAAFAAFGALAALVRGRDRPPQMNEASAPSISGKALSAPAAEVS
jgi:hypothetical protein